MSYPTLWQLLDAFDLGRINGHWKKIESMKYCVHCGGHKDGVKLKTRVCPGSFGCQVLKDAHCKLIKIGSPVKKPPPTPGGALATVVAPGPTVPEDEVVDPSGKTAVLIDLSSVETPDSFVWAGAEDDND